MINKMSLFFTLCVWGGGSGDGTQGLTYDKGSTTELYPQANGYFLFVYLCILIVQKINFTMMFLYIYIF
jgi:hypothetical protein